jgi:oligopeptide/dipeptide ABC transporter ATP-binding protein
MYLGRVVEHGPVNEIFEAPKHPYTRALLQSIPSRHKTARVQLPTIAGSIPNPFNRPAGCTFHPRCTQAIAGVCDRSVPPSYAPSDGHRVDCHAYNGAGSPISADPIPANGRSVGRRAPAKSEPVLLQVNHLRKEYAVQGRRLGQSRGSLTAVDDVTFELRTAETLALVGESGSGKTTTSRCILRAIAPESGDILFRTRAGEVVNLATLPAKSMRPLRPEIQMIFQDPYSSLNPRMTILDLIGEPLLVNGVKSRQERSDRVEELLRLVGLRAEFMRRFPHAFSGGQRQRIGIARALALNPRLVVADEPVSALDVSVQAQTLNLLMELQDRLHLTYLFVAHDLSVVRHISDRTGVMFAGQLVELGETRAILEEPKHPYTAALLAAIPKPDPRARAMFNIPRAKGDPGELLKGCQFQRRCQFATKICEVEKPAWQEVEPGRHVRCHRVDEIELRPPVMSKNGRAERSPLPG